MVIYKVTSAFKTNKAHKYYYHYFDTLQNAEQWVKEACCELYDDYGGIYKMEPNEKGEFIATKCEKCW